MSTPFDYESADYLSDMVKIYKISSSDITNIPFIEHIARKGKPIYLSTGASYISEIESAVRAIKEAGGREVSLLHCVLSYPTKSEDANLNMIKHLKNIFPNEKIGYSDHTLPDDCMTVLTTAYLLGAEIIEKHFTLNKRLPGNDHYHAMDPIDLKKFVNNIELIRKITGQFAKTVLNCELVPRREARRSIVLSKDKKKGDTIQNEDIIIKRPGSGIYPEYLSVILGKKINKDLFKDTILTWNDFLN